MEENFTKYLVCEHYGRGTPDFSLFPCGRFGSDGEAKRVALEDRADIFGWAYKYVYPFLIFFFLYEYLLAIGVIVKIGDRGVRGAFILF